MAEKALYEGLIFLGLMRRPLIFGVTRSPSPTPEGDRRAAITIM